MVARYAVDLIAKGISHIVSGKEHIYKEEMILVKNLDLGNW